MSLNQKNENGHNFNVSGSNNTIAGGNIDKNIHISGHVSGGNVVLGAVQTVHGNLTVTVGMLPAASEDVRETLKKQIAELMVLLEKQPIESAKQVQEVKMAIEDIVMEAEKEHPAKSRLEIRGEILMEAAQNLLAVAPIAVAIAKTLTMIG